MKKMENTSQLWFVRVKLNPSIIEVVWIQELNFKLCHIKENISI